MTLQAASYCRVSSDGQEQDGSSLSTQAEAIAKYCREHGYTLAPEHRYHDAGTGAEYRERPGLNALRDAIRHKEVDVFVCYALD